MSRSLQEKIIEYIQVTGAALEKAEKQAADKAATENRISALIPKAVEALLNNGRIEAHEKDASAKVLTDPEKVLQVLINTANHKNAEELSRLGTVTHTKKASATPGSLSSPYVGVRSSGEKDSDIAFFSKLGLR